MKDFIVLMIIAIIVITSSIAKSKKRVQPQNIKPAMPDNLWDIMKELGMQPPTLQPVENIIETAEIAEEQEENHLYGFSASEEGGSIFKGGMLKNDLTIKKPNKDNTIKNERFSLKKAVIYSEILNQKYI